MKDCIAQATLPTETCFNDQWSAMTVPYVKLDKLDKLAHKGVVDEPDYYACIEEQFAFIVGISKHSAEVIERMGYPVGYLPVDRRAVVSPETLSGVISDSTKLVSVMLSNNEVGTIQPIRELADIAHRHGALFHTDAVQATGHIPVDVKALGVDMLSASAHKFNGPKGIGFLYVKNGTPILPFNDGGAQESGRRAGTENVAGIVGMAAALKKSCAEIEAYSSLMRKLESALLTKLDKAGLDYCRNGGQARVPGNISLSFNGISGEMLLHRLDLKNIFVSTGSACDSRNTQISHVLRAMQLPEEYALGTIRVSFGKYNTPEDAEEIANAIISIISGISVRR